MFFQIVFDRPPAPSPFLRQSAPAGQRRARTRKISSIAEGDLSPPGQGRRQKCVSPLALRLSRYTNLPLGDSSLFPPRSQRSFHPERTQRIRWGSVETRCLPLDNPRARATPRFASVRASIDTRIQHSVQGPFINSPIHTASRDR